MTQGRVEYESTITRSTDEGFGGPNKTVEIVEIKFGRQKYHRGHHVEGQWVFGGVEWESSRTFLVPIPNRTADTLVAIICDWIEPGTMVISDGWAAYRDLESQGFMHCTVNHAINFIDPDTRAHTNTIESTWRAVKVFLGQYNRGEDYECHLTQYMFVARCKAFHRFYSSLTSSLTPTWPSVMCHLPLPAPRVHTTVSALHGHLLLQVCVVCCCVTFMTRHPHPPPSRIYCGLRLRWRPSWVQDSKLTY